MRKIITLTFMSLDGVIQAPGNTHEDTSGNFKFGGWSIPYFEEFLGEEMTSQMKNLFLYHLVESLMKFLPAIGLKMQVIGRALTKRQNM